MDIRPLDIVIHIINIAVLYALLRIILYDPIQRFLRQRSDAIAKDIADADALKADAAKLRNEYGERIKGAEQEAHQLLIEGSKKAGEEADAIVAAAKTEAQNMLSRAQTQVELQRRDAIAKLEPQISEMAVSLAGQILRREVSASDNQKVIESFFEKEVQQR